MHQRTIEVVNLYEVGNENTVYITLYVPDNVDDEEYIDIWVNEHFNGSFDWDFYED